MGKPLHVLVVEDSEDDALLLLRELRRGGYDPICERVDTQTGMGTALVKQTWDLVVIDYHLPRFSAHAALELLKGSGQDLPCIVVSGKVGEEAAVATMKAGAHDFIVKQNLARLIPAIERELREAVERRERRRAEAMIEHMAYYDVLTGLPNRNLLYDRLQQAIRLGQRNQTQGALALMDLDRFKEINDTLGHHRGDLILQQVGLRVQSALRDSDTVARLGGDEFAMVLPTIETGDHAGVVVRKVLQALESPFMLDGLLLEIGGSVGVALFPDHGTEADLLMQRADVAMYVAKQDGSGHTVYAAEHDRYSPRRLTLARGLRQAIDENQLLLHYQPKVNLRTGRVIGTEALARWQHPTLGLIPPDQFIAVAEQTGLIKPVTEWVLTAALRQAQAWRQAEVELPVAVNLSARSLQDPQLPAQITGLLQTHRLAAEALEFEITESSIMADPARSSETLARLRKMGIRISIDDFGTGYSSLSHLKNLSVDALKIDKSFVINMMGSEGDSMLVSTTIELAHNLGLKVIAEGIETQPASDRLASLGCDAGQGYYIGRPMPADDLTRWVRESPWGLKAASPRPG